MCVVAGLWEGRDGERSFETLLQCSSLIFDAQQTGEEAGGLSARSPLKLETMRGRKKEFGGK